MCKSIESVFAVISAQTAFPNSAKRKIFISKLPYGIIYTTTTKWNFFNPFFFGFFIFCKQVK